MSGLTKSVSRSILWRHAIIAAIAVLVELLTGRPIGFSILAVAGVIVAACLLLLPEIWTEELDESECPACGYDLRGSPTPICSECGVDTTQPGIRERYAVLPSSTACVLLQLASLPVCLNFAVAIARGIEWLFPVNLPNYYTNGNSLAFDLSVIGGPMLAYVWFYVPIYLARARLRRSPLLLFVLIAANVASLAALAQLGYSIARFD
ncbi:MAG: hypothetical protein SF069_14700 [Phycisphaerae bacterium]|nr:hypothetical protein [Phycisphaerae bacterium]